VPGVHGAGSVRYDAFIAGREDPGTRIGLSLVGGGSLWPLQQSREVDETGTELRSPFSFQQYGVMAVVRGEPTLPWSGTFGFGMQRLDLEDWYSGAQAVPLLVVEAGGRRLLGQSWGYLDLGLRSGWGSARGADGEWTEWWEVQLTLGGGIHLR
jgi:hypothetical protein